VIEDVGETEAAVGSEEARDVLLSLGVIEFVIEMPDCFVPEQVRDNGALNFSDACRQAVVDDALFSGLSGQVAVSRKLEDPDRHTCNRDTADTSYGPEMVAISECHGGSPRYREALAGQPQDRVEELVSIEACS